MVFLSSIILSKSERSAEVANMRKQVSKMITVVLNIALKLTQTCTSVHSMSKLCIVHRLYHCHMNTILKTYVANLAINSCKPTGLYIPASAQDTQNIKSVKSWPCMQVKNIRALQCFLSLSLLNNCFFKLICMHLVSMHLITTSAVDFVSYVNRELKRCTSSTRMVHQFNTVWSMKQRKLIYLAIVKQRKWVFLLIVRQLNGVWWTTLHHFRYELFSNYYWSLIFYCSEIIIV